MRDKASGNDHVSQIKRVTLAAIAGLGVGAAAVVLLARTPREVTVPTLWSGASRSALTEAIPSISTRPRSAEILDTSSRAAITMSIEDADARELTAMLRDGARATDSSTRLFTLETLIRRLAEIDLDQALSVVRELDLNPRAARIMGHALLDQMPLNESSFTAVLEALLQIDSGRFRLQAIATVALESPSLAIQLMLQMPERSYRDETLSTVARLWVERDGAGALRHAAEIADDDTRFAVEAAIVRQWAFVDAGLAAAYLNHTDLQAQLSKDRRSHDFWCRMRSGKIHCVRSS